MNLQNFWDWKTFPCIRDNTHTGDAKDMDPCNIFGNTAASVNEHLERFNAAMHQSVKEVGCVSAKRNKPKLYWCPELSIHVC